MNSLIVSYVLNQYKQLTNKNKCCMNWLGPFRSLEPIYLHYIVYFDLKYKVQIINGLSVTKIYKPHCNHVIDVPTTFHLTPQSQKDILYYLKHCDYEGFNQDVLILPQVFRLPRQKPVLPPNRFTIGPIRQAVYHCNSVTKQMSEQYWKIFPSKMKILQMIRNNRIVVINGDVSLEKSTAVPMFIVDESTMAGNYCKILCVELDNLSAITNSSLLTKNINERIGSRVGFQVYLQSRVCDNTNLIYTTSIFFLRVLMGQNPKESFHHISHIVLSDVHLHHAYTDILLHEIKNILPYYPKIKVILLSNGNENSKFLSYFGEGVELKLHLTQFDVRLHYLEEIDAMLEGFQKSNGLIEQVNMILPRVESNGNIDKDWADKILEDYYSTGNDTAFKRFLYLVNAENVTVNYSHSKHGYTALMASVKYGNSLHLKRLLSFPGANPFIHDKQKFTALDHAVSRNNIGCIATLLQSTKENVCDYNACVVDFTLIENLIMMIRKTWQFGHILVFLPAYEDLLKLKYKILKLQFIGKLSNDVLTYSLHPNMQSDQLQQIMAKSLSTKIILCTRKAESLSYLNDITYVIDACLDCTDVYDSDSRCSKTANEWSSKESLQARLNVAGRSTLGHCFRLIPKGFFHKLPLVSVPELLQMPMSRICLMAKLLCPYKQVAEYFQCTIVKPPSVHVMHGIEFLKTIEVFDCMEDVTWLGCRLIDVPVELELGKSLVLSILFKCLDPVLTIVSFLTCTNNQEADRCKNCITVENIFEKDTALYESEDLFSDHLILLRLYELWQNDKRENIVNEVLNDENNYIINGILDKVCGVRTHLVGALRSCQLIHNQGQLSMHSINSKANNWAIIKAALTGGLYPKLCVIDRREFRLKSKSRELCIHRNSTLRHARHSRSTMREHPHCPSDWIIFFKETDSIIVNSISECTIISPLTVAMFSGKAEPIPESVLFDKSGHANANLFVDEWIHLTTDPNSALLLYKLRQRFYYAYMDFLQACGNSEKWKKSNVAASEISRFIELVTKVVLNEDVNSKFAQPIRVGNRPKAVASRFISDFEIGIDPKEPIIRSCIQDITLPQPEYRPLVKEREFFLINIFDSHAIRTSLAKLSTINISRDVFFKQICGGASVQKLTYVILCSVNQKRITNVAVVKFHASGCLLKNSFQVSIPVYDILIVCATLKLQLPSFKQSNVPIKLDNSVGEAVLELL